MTDISPREKALVEAVSAHMKYVGRNIYTEDARNITRDLREALRAYDPPKPKVPQIPEWEEFVNLIGQTPSVASGGLYLPDFNATVFEHQYNAIRTLTSKEAE